MKNASQKGKTRRVLSEMTAYQMVATIEALENGGVTEECFRVIRADKSLANEIADFIVNKTVKSYRVDEQLLSILEPERFFGPTDWIKYFGIDLPKNINLPIPIQRLQEILESPCPFVKGKKVKETHYLYWLPSCYNGESLTTKKWHSIFPKDRQPRFYSYVDDDVSCNDDCLDELDIARFSWFLMFQGIIPGSESKNWEDQLWIKPDNYEVPKVVEVIPMHFLPFQKNDGYRSNEKMWGRTYDLDEYSDHVNAGNFDYDGFVIRSNYDSLCYSNLGLFLFRKLLDLES